MYLKTAPSAQTHIQPSPRRHREHASHGLEDFKDEEVLKKYLVPVVAQDEQLFDTEEEDPQPLIEKDKDLSRIIKEKFGSLFLKLESTFNVSNKCIDEIVNELQFISCTASVPVIRELIESTLRTHSYELDTAVISDLVKILSEAHPISSALASDGPFSTSYKRRQFIKEQFSVVEPKEYILDEKEGKTFHYVPILQSLSQVLNKHNQEKLLDTDRNLATALQYQSFHDGSNFQKNVFFL